MKIKKCLMPLMLAFMMLCLPLFGARAFSGTKTLDGNNFDASIMRQRITLVNIWSTTCGPCKVELPELGRIAKDFQDRLNVVGILVNSAPWDAGQAAVTEALGLLSSAKVDYPNLIMDSSLTDFVFGDERTISVPLTHFVDTDGRVVKTRVGPLSYDGWKDLIAEVLQGSENPVPFPGDATNNGTVDILDLVAIIDYIVSDIQPASPVNANANGKDGVDILDLVWVIDTIVGG